MSDTLKSVAVNVGALVLGELVGGISEEVTKRVRVHRAELGAPTVGTGSGRYDTMLDLLLDISIEVVFLMIGVNLIERAVPAIDEDLSAIIMLIIGISTTQTHLIGNLKKLTNAFMADAPAQTMNSNLEQE